MFAAIAIATIALSIGAATSIYSVVDGVLFRSLPYHDARRLVAIWQTDPDRKKNATLAANWDRVPSAHLYHAISALKRTGQDFTARMIAAEALSRT